MVVSIAVLGLGGYTVHEVAGRNPGPKTGSSGSLFLTVNLGLLFKSILSPLFRRLVSWLFQVV